jgi:hypothetical protein
MGVIQVPDINGQPQEVCFQQPGTPSDRSGTCDGNSDVVLEAVPTGSTRAGWLIQNKSTAGNLMFVNDLGSPADQSPTSVILQPGESFPPPGYPITQGEVQVLGAVGDNYMAREW